MIFYWNPNPIALSIETLNFKIYWYGILFALGFFIGYIIARLMCKKKGYPIDKLDMLLFYVFLGTIIGARLAHVLFYQPNYYLSNPLEILYIWKGGLASHGGTIGAFIGFSIFCYKNREFSPLWLLDHLSIAVALVATLIRIGNFINSEITGIPTDGSYGIVFERISNVPLHPVQLYESTCYFFIMLFLLILYKLHKDSNPGLMFGIFLTWVFSSRMVLEIFKSSQAEYEITMNNWISNFVDLPFMVSVGMLLSIPFIIIGIGFIWYSIKHREITQK